jgi:aspartate carbamoyltransferase catalytic subunit
MLRHVINAQQFNVKLIQDLFTRADELQKLTNSKRSFHRLGNILSDRMMFLLFFEPSTRTRISFSAAGQHLGMKLVTAENARESSSSVKGESLEDAIRVLCQYKPDIIVLRHYEVDSAKRASKVSDVPIINAGDGHGQHPTQALLDLYTIQRENGRLNNLTVVLGTDLKHSRSVRSLSYLLAKYPNNHLIFVSPKELRIGQDIKTYLKKHDTSYEETDNIEKALTKADVVYWNRIQKERFTSDIPPQTFIIGEEQLKMLKPKASLLNPLPRIDEITKAVDVDPRAAYFRQAGNGMFVRMALIEWVLDIL